MHGVKTHTLSFTLRGPESQIPPACQSLEWLIHTHSEHRFPAPSSQEKGCRKPVLGASLNGSAWSLLFKHTWEKGSVRQNGMSVSESMAWCNIEQTVYLAWTLRRAFDCSGFHMRLLWKINTKQAVGIGRTVNWLANMHNVKSSTYIYAYERQHLLYIGAKRQSKTTTHKRSSV